MLIGWKHESRKKRRMLGEIVSTIGCSYNKSDLQRIDTSNKYIAGKRGC